MTTEENDDASVRSIDNYDRKLSNDEDDKNQYLNASKNKNETNNQNESYLNKNNSN